MNPQNPNPGPNPDPDPSTVPQPPAPLYTPPAEQQKRWTPPHFRFFSRPVWLILLALVLVAVIAVITYAYSSQNRGSLFDQALTKALQTSNFTQLMSDGQSHLTIRYDVSTPASSRVQTDGKIVQGDTTIAYNGYGTFKDSYMKFTTFTTAGTSVKQEALGKWFQVRKDGFDASRGYFAMLFQNDPHSAFFGDLIFGNFSDNDRTKLLDYLHQHNVYKVDETKVQHEQYQGQPAAVYDLTEDTTALAGFNKLVGSTIGIPSAELTEDLSNMQYAGSSKIYISEKTKQFVHIKAHTSSVDYYDYGTTKLGGAPTPQTTFEQFENLIVTPQPSNSQSI